MGNIIFHSYIRWLHKTGQKSLDTYFDKRDDGFLSPLLKNFSPSIINPCFMNIIVNGVRETGKSKIDTQVFMETILSASISGLFFEDETLFLIACEIAYLTSKSSATAYNSGYLALLINFLKRGYSMEASAKKSKKIADVFFHEQFILKEITDSIEFCKVREIHFDERISLAYSKGGKSPYTAIITGLISSFFYEKLPLSSSTSFEMNKAIDTIAFDTAKISVFSDYSDGEWLFKYPAW